MAKGRTGRKKVKGFLTQYALSAGIQEVEVEFSPDGKYAWYRIPGATYQNIVEICEVHENRADAEKAQKRKAKAKILSLKKKIGEMEELILKPRYARGSE
jgi:hypothetical protein